MIDEQLKQALIDIKTYHNKSAALKDVATKKQNDQAFSEFHQPCLRH